MANLTEEQAMLRDMASAWVDNESPVTAFRRLRDTPNLYRFDPDAWRAQVEMGWAGILIPEAYGGVDMGFRSLGVVVEQLGRNLVSTPLVVTSLAAAAIVDGGSDEQKAKWLPRIASGEVIATLALDEGPRFNPSLCNSRVEGGRMYGSKAFVAEGSAAHLFVVGASDGFYLIATGEGVRVSDRHLADFRGHADVAFDGVEADALAGGRELTQRIADRAALIASAEMLGMAEAAFAQTNAYLKTRVQFGQILSSFQALQHRMARMFTEIELLRSAVEAGLDAAERKAALGQEASLAKAAANDVLHLVSREMIQLHGGIGMTDEHDAGFYLKRARVLEQRWGTAAWHRDRFARLNGY